MAAETRRSRLREELAGVPAWKVVESGGIGNQAAYRSGLISVAGDAVVFLDADLQDSPKLIPEMITLS
jgi:hypothetical protein